MKTKITVFLLFTVAIITFAFRSFSIQTGQDPWTDKQLMEPSELAKSLNTQSDNEPIVYSIGFEGGIRGSIEMGPAKETENLEKFKNAVSKLPKNTAIVIYCGCCPFEHCPNIRPAFKLLNDMKFTNAKLLNLSHNLKADWIDKGYPMNK